MKPTSWRTEIIKESENDELLDYIDVEPGPEMRGHLRAFFESPGGAVYLLVHYRPSGLCRRARIQKDPRTFRAMYDGQWLTLEEAAKRMKRELEAACRTNPR